MDPMKERGKEGKERDHAEGVRMHSRDHGESALASDYPQPPCCHDGGRGRGFGPPHGIDGHARRPSGRVSRAPLHLARMMESASSTGESRSEQRAFHR